MEQHNHCFHERDALEIPTLHSPITRSRPKSIGAVCAPFWTLPRPLTTRMQRSKYL
jgi:hypothetical protein